MINKSLGAFSCLPFTNASDRQPKAPAASVTDSAMRYQAVSELVTQTNVKTAGFPVAGTRT
ncbi:hypothetical protein L4B25_29405, partial [Salmonella enterica subsp. diarizonae serovar 16:z10:e,n,x,z15]|nr:hypothetical protein [Salmonella enterica subsp. diarizonae serovar 16:z10:e,n,x,z15]MCH5507144.1 hypothetical protein [Salmonella enterica subsp. diarizonae serovar 16:z10:e,n,x,z15]